MLSELNSKEEQIIVLKYNDKNVGLIVDKAVSVHGVHVEDIEHCPSFVNNQLIDGIIRFNDQLITILDVETLIKLNAEHLKHSR